MKRRIFGAPEGPLVVYFHGAPGAASEADVLRPYAEKNGLTVICLDRFSIDSSITGDQYFQALADEIVHLAKGKQVDIVAFSIGACVALQVSALMSGQVRSLHLISAAAPLEGGNFLPYMAGRQVFMLAKRLPLVFKMLSYWQGVLAVLFPKLLFGMLFSSAVAGDKKLTADDDFRKSMGQVFRECFGGNVAGYLRDVQAYVTPWHTVLQRVTVMTRLSHGDQDNWSPIAMSDYLQQHILNAAKVRLMPGLSHYSTLYSAAPLICQQLGRQYMANRVSGSVVANPVGE